LPENIVDLDSLPTPAPIDMARGDEILATPARELH
jgi:hypothetical protein